MTSTHLFIYLSLMQYIHDVFLNVVTMALVRSVLYESARLRNDAESLSLRLSVCPSTLGQLFQKEFGETVLRCAFEIHVSYFGQECRGSRF